LNFVNLISHDNVDDELALLLLLLAMQMTRCRRRLSKLGGTQNFVDMNKKLV
jgi:hypothetical protein